MPVDPSRRNEPHPRHLREGLSVSVISLVWTVATSAAEIALGLAHHLLSLAVFGAAGALDAAGSGVLIFHFRHALHHGSLADRHERAAALVISIGLIALAVLTLFESALRLASGHIGEATSAGTVIAAASVVVLGTLAPLKRRVGRRVESEALVADGWLSTSGAVLAAFALLGATFGSHPGRSWIDPTAAIVIAAIAGGYGTTILVHEQRLRG